MAPQIWASSLGALGRLVVCSALSPSTKLPYACTCSERTKDGFLLAGDGFRQAEGAALCCYSVRFFQCGNISPITRCRLYPLRSREGNCCEAVEASAAVRVSRLIFHLWAKRLRCKYKQVLQVSENSTVAPLGGVALVPRFCRTLASRRLLNAGNVLGITPFCSIPC